MARFNPIKPRKGILQTKGVLGEETYKLLRRIPVERVKIDSQKRVTLHLLRHIDKKDATTLLKAVNMALRKDRRMERKELGSVERAFRRRK